MKAIRLATIAVLVVLISVPAFGGQIRVAAWNIEHLRDQNFEGPNARTDIDYDRLAGYAAMIDADVVALQEVEGQSAAERIFPPSQYDFYFSSRNHPMQTGFAVRKELTVTQNPDYEALNVAGGQRHGTDISVMVDGQEVRMLSVHLQSGCWEDDIYSPSEPCVILSQQMHRLEQWIDQRAAEGVPFLVMGDFNRRFDIPNDQFWSEIDDGNPPNADLSRVTEGLDSGCWVGHYPPQYIDHIVLDKIATGWVVPGSFNQIVYSEGADLKEELSDHCPISVVIDVPSSPSTPSAPTTFRVVD